MNVLTSPSSAHDITDIKTSTGPARFAPGQLVSYDGTECVVVDVEPYQEGDGEAVYGSTHVYRVAFDGGPERWVIEALLEPVTEYLELLAEQDGTAFLGPRPW